MRQRLDGTGQVLAVNGFRPFGLPLEGEGDAPYGYSGEWWEEDAGLLFLRARYYDPVTGRFLSRDSWRGNVRQPGTLHRYVYLLNDPVNGADPSGHCPPGGCVILEGGAIASPMITFYAHESAVMGREPSPEDLHDWFDHHPSYDPRRDPVMRDPERYGVLYDQRSYVLYQYEIWYQIHYGNLAYWSLMGSEWAEVLLLIGGSAYQANWALSQEMAMAAGASQSLSAYQGLSGDDLLAKIDELEGCRGGTGSERPGDRKNSGRVAYLLGGGAEGDLVSGSEGALLQVEPKLSLPADQVRGLSENYDRVIVNDLNPQNLENLKQILEHSGGIPENVDFLPAANATTLGKIEDADIYIVAPDGRWMGTMEPGSPLAETLNSVVGRGSRAFTITEFDTADLVHTLRQYEWKKGIVGPYFTGSEIAQGVPINSIHFSRIVNLLILGR